MSILYWCFSFWLTSLCIIGSSFIHLIRTLKQEISLLLSYQQSAIYMHECVYTYVSRRSLSSPPSHAPRPSQSLRLGSLC